MRGVRYNEWNESSNKVQRLLEIGVRRSEQDKNVIEIIMC